MLPQVLLGSNAIQNSNGVLVIDGTDQVILERGEHDGQLLVTIDLYDDQGTHQAKLRRNAWAFTQDRFEATTSPTNLTLTARESGEVVFEARIVGQDSVEVSRARFYSADGTLVQVLPDGLIVGGVQIRHNLISGFDQAIVIDKTGISLGASSGSPEPDHPTPPGTELGADDSSPG